MMNDQPFDLQAALLKRPLGPAPGFQGQLRIIRLSQSISHDKFAPMVENRHQLGFGPTSPIDDLRKIRVQDLKIVDLGQPGHKIHPGAGLFEKPGHGARFGLPNSFDHRQIPARVQPLNDFMVHLDAPLPKLGLRSTVPVFRVSSGDLQQGFPQPRMLVFIAALLPGVMPGPLGQPQGPQDSVQTVFALEFAG